MLQLLWWRLLGSPGLIKGGCGTCGKAGLGFPEACILWTMTDPGTKVEPKPHASPIGGGYLCTSFLSTCGPFALKVMQRASTGIPGDSEDALHIRPALHTWGRAGQPQGEDLGPGHEWAVISGQHFSVTTATTKDGVKLPEEVKQSDLLQSWEKKGPPNGLSLWSISLQQGWKFWKRWSLKAMQRAPFPLIPSWRGRLLIAMCIFRGLNHCLKTWRVNTSTITA